ncbi:unnamed protein product [Cochlearia groenlandica]
MKFTLKSGIWELAIRRGRRSTHARADRWRVGVWICEGGGRRGGRNVETFFSLSNRQIETCLRRNGRRVMWTRYCHRVIARMNRRVAGLASGEDVNVSGTTRFDFSKMNS